MFVFFFKFLMAFVISLARLAGATMPALWHWINQARTTAPVVSDAEFKIILKRSLQVGIHVLSKEVSGVPWFVWMCCVPNPPCDYFTSPSRLNGGSEYILER